MASTTTNESAALTSLAAAEESLRQTTKSDFAELRSFAKPPLGCLAVLEGVGILIDPSKEVREWTDDKRLMSQGRDTFLAQLFTFDKDKISVKQLEKLKSVLARDDCQPAELAKTSPLCSRLCSWLRAIVEYATQRQEVH